MEKSVVDVYVNNDQAKEKVKELQVELKQLIALRDKAGKEGDAKGFIQLNKEATKATNEINRLEKKVIDVDKVLKNLSSVSIQTLEKSLRKVNAEIKGMDRNDPFLANKQKQASLLSAELDKAMGRTKTHDRSLRSLSDGFNRYFAIVTTAIATFTGVVFGMRKAVDVFNLFEKRVDNLSALTGLVGKALQWLSKEAKRLSTSVIEGNVRIASTATEIVDAYTKVGSKRPELLKIKEDLNSVTKEALILSAAASGDLQPAVEGLTMVLNQFNAPASESRRVINVLAAGSKEGAGEIDYLTAGFEKAGSVASSFNISVEELTGTLETLAPRMTEPEMAGRSLRNIMIKLETQSDKNLKPSIVGLGKAFEYMKEKQYDVTKLTELFGTENINAANILINNTAEMNKYTKAVTGTNVALEQAATNTDNNATKLQQAKNRVENLTIEFGEKFAPAMTFSTNSFAYFMKAVMGAPAFITRYQIALIALIAASLAYRASLIQESLVHAYNNLLLKEGIGLRIKNAIADSTLAARKQLLIIWTMGETTATKLAATAQLAWNTAISLNPLGALIVTIAAVIIAIKSYDKYGAESLRLEHEKYVAIDKLSKANNDLSTSYKNQAIAIGQMNKMSAEQKQNLYNQTKATLDQAEAELILVEATQKRIQQDNTRATTWQRFVNTILSVNNPALANVWNAVDAAKNGAEAADVFTESIAKMRDQIKQLWGQYSSMDEQVNAEKLADAITGKSGSQLEEKQRLLTLSLKNFEKGTTDYLRISKKLSDVNIEINTDPVVDQVNAYARLSDEIEKLDERIKNLIASNQAVPDSLIHQLASKRAELEKVNEAIKNIAVSISKMSGAKQTPDKLIDEAWFAVRPKDSKLRTKPDDTPEEIKRAGDIDQAQKDAAIAIAESTQNAIFDIIKNRQQAELDQKLSMLEAQREAELDNANLTEEQKAAINEKYRKREADMKLAAWKKEKAANIVSSIMKTALAVLTQLSGGDPITALPRAIAAGVMGAAETAVIIAQKPPQFYKGGFTDEDPDDYKPAGVVHTNEFVANADATRNPTIRPVLNLIDYAQRAGTVRNINLPAVIESSVSRSVGSIPSGTNNAVAGQQVDPEMIVAMNKFVDAVDRLEKNGVKGNWVYQDFKTMADKEKTAISKSS